MIEDPGFLEQVIRLLISWGALPWWAAILAAVLMVAWGFLKQRYGSGPLVGRENRPEEQPGALDVPPATGNWTTDPASPGGDASSGGG